MNRGEGPKVLIVGGGVGALEAAVGVQILAGEKARIELCSGRDDFSYRPFAVGEPYGASRVLRYDLRRLAAACGAEHRRENVSRVDTARRCVHTDDGSEVPYDYLIVSCGARLLRSVPGAATFWGIVDEGELQGAVRKLREGRLRRLVFAVPDRRGWPLPAYELVLMAAAEVERSCSAARLTVVTPEDRALQTFGRRASRQVGSLLAAHGVEVLTGVDPIEYERGTLSVAAGEPIEADAVVTLPRLEGRRIEGLPYDAAGFIPVDRSCRIAGAEHAFAVGDVTDFPAKQSGIATQQADAAVEAIAADLGCDVEVGPFDPVLRGVLWTRPKPHYLFGWFGGDGEASIAGERPPWPIDNPSRLIGRFLSPFLTQLSQTPAPR